MAERYKLRASQIGKATKAGWQNDGGGLYLRTSPALTQSWVFRYRDRTQRGKLRDVGLGSASDITLAKARELAGKARDASRSGRDPKLAVRQTGGPITFQQAAEQYIASHSPKWSNAKHKSQWESTLKNYAYPTLGNLGIEVIETDHVYTVLKDIWFTKTETASRVRMRMESVLSWATARGYRSGFNPAVWRGHLDQLLPKRADIQKPKHFAAIEYPTLPHAYADWGDSLTAKALRFTVLTACRTSEVINARWSEFDRDVWTIPGERMKSRREHRVPLSQPAIAVLESLDRNSGWVFPGLKPGKPLSNMAMLSFLKKKHPGITVHGMRSAFRDWAAEETDHPEYLAEMALAHVVENRVEAAYRRGDLLKKRRLLMDDWGRYIA